MQKKSLKIFTNFFQVTIFLFGFSGCFIFPQIGIQTALRQKDCMKLYQKYILDLSFQQIQSSVSICKKKGFYKETIRLLNHLEKKSFLQKEKEKVWKEKSQIYGDYLFEYNKAVLEIRKLEATQSLHLIWKKKIVEYLVKNQSFTEALEWLRKISLKELKESERLKIQFIEARLLSLLKKKKESLKLFYQIQKQNTSFFSKNHGFFYVALLLEEEKKFLEASKELQKTDWIFFDTKGSYWQKRQQNLAK